MQYVQASHNHLIMTAAYVSENKRQSKLASRLTDMQADNNGDPGVGGDPCICKDGIVPEE